MSPDKILVIEDSELLQKGYNLLFHRYRTTGCEVIRALNGKEGLERLCQHPDVDLIILDLCLCHVSYVFSKMNALIWRGGGATTKLISTMGVQQKLTYVKG